MDVEQSPHERDTHSTTSQRSSELSLSSLLVAYNIIEGQETSQNSLSIMGKWELMRLRAVAHPQRGEKGSRRGGDVLGDIAVLAWALGQAE